MPKWIYPTSSAVPTVSVSTLAVRSLAVIYLTAWLAMLLPMFAGQISRINAAMYWIHFARGLVSAVAFLAMSWPACTVVHDPRARGGYPPISNGE